MMKRSKFFYFISLFLFSFFCFGIYTIVVSTNVSAQGTLQEDVFGVAELADEEEGLVLGAGDIRQVVARIINIFLGLLGIIAIGIIIYAGFLWMTANGNDDQIARAKKMLTNGAIGLIIILSSFTIARFIFRSFSDATGLRVGQGEEQNGDNDPRCQGPNPPLFCIPEDELQCEDTHFVITSISPSTVGNPVDPTDMNNIVVRAVFSQPLAANTNANDVFTVTTISGDTVPVTVAIIPGRLVVEATIQRPDTCTQGQTCFDAGTYRVTVNPNLRSEARNDQDSLPLEINDVDDCGTYPNIASFVVNTEGNIDTTKPIISDFTVNNQSGDAVVVARNSSHTIKATVSDQNNEQNTAGSSYVRLRIFEEGTDPAQGKIIYDGPSVVQGTSQPFSFEYDYYLPRCTQCSVERYITELTAYDIDHNVSIATSSLVVVGERCDELGAALPGARSGECLDDTASCTQDWQCPSQRCVDNRCVAFPIIIDVDPWDGATGNLLTIFGRYFGEDEGTVEFGFDTNNDGDITATDAWIPASLSQCQDVDVWHDDWVIASVPAGGGYALQLDQQRGDGSVFIPDNNILDVTQSITIESWVYPQQLPADGAHVFRKNNAYGFWVSQTNQPWGRIWQSDGTQVNTVQNKSIINQQWNHIAFVADAGNSTLTLYVNGEISSQVPYNGTIQVSGDPLRIGSFNGTQGNWNGGIDEVRVYNRALSNQEIISRYTQQQDVSNQGLLAYWPFEELSGITVTDQSGNAIHGEYRGNAVVLGTLVSPYGASFQAGDLAAIRITRANDNTFQDSTVDDHGVKPGPRAGLWQKTDVVRPGLCRVVAGDSLEDARNNITVALPGDAVIAQGQSFGDMQTNVSELLFGGISSPVSSWANQLIFGSIPNTIRSGRVGVRVRVGDVQSNGVPFTISATDEQLLPVIESIDPARVTAQSYITIFGQRFGSDTGEVFLADSPELAITCANAEPANRPATCVQLLTTLPGCGVGSWQDTSVVVGIPEDTSPRDRYYLVLKKRNGLVTTGQDVLEVITGEPHPSICQIVPSSGPAPTADSVRIYGSHLSGDTDPAVYFWWKNAIETDFTTWLSASNAERLGGGSILGTRQTSTELDIYIPVLAADGISSMESGPIRISVDGRVSNSVYYEVSRCTDEGSTPPAEGYRCCSQGVGAGQWVPENRSCPGETHDAGYVWRFTTGKIPERLRVIEECSQQQGEPQFSAIPSPTPWYSSQLGQGWADGNRACVNADIAVRFSLPLKESSVTEQSVLVYTCGTGDSSDCDNASLVSDQFVRIVELNGDQGVIKLRPNPNDQGDSFLAANTWYRVALTDDILSQKDVVILGTNVERNEPLLPTRPIEDTPISYYFEFKTSAGICQLTGAGIQPPQYIARELGVAQDSRFPYDVGPNSENNPQHPLYYYVWGKGDQSCRVINVDGLGWQWRVANEQNHTVPDARATVSTASGNGYTDSRATVKAIENTFPDAVDVIATASIEPTPIETDSSFIVDLGTPRVISTEPNCLASCTNASIRAVFNRRMDVTTYEAGFRLFECSDANCLVVTPVPREQYDLSHSTPDELLMEWKPGLVMKPNTYYKVSLNGVNGVYNDLGQIKALGRISPPLPGTALDSFEWRFRTKEDGQACTINHVEVAPASWTARSIQERTVFQAIPYSSPNECSTRGQRLSAWAYGWDWTSLDEQVATVTSFDTGNVSIPSYCSELCTPRGSDIDAAAAATIRLCGNGRVDAGEDCDIASSNEFVPITCTLSCLRPGSENRGTAAGQCGNGIVDNPTSGVQSGEQCDPGSDENGSPRTTDPYCSSTCQLRGSSVVTSQDQVNASVCGDGAVTFGESCDTAISGTIGCTASCLQAGTRVAERWCELPNNRFINSTECLQAVSVCGNGVIERGETCEIGVRGATAQTCTSRCLLQHVCNTPLAECEQGTPGCSSDCTLLGSSLLYATPSLCGDGVSGIGEFEGVYGPDFTSYQCDVALLPEQDRIPGSSPVQLVTAVGASFSADPLGFQSTTIQAVVHDSVAQLGRETGGVAAYALQCGYQEFQTPLPDANGALQFNDCVLLDDDDTNDIGVGSNSCCYPRMTRVASYPVDGSGIANQSESVCRNTLLSVSFNGYVDPETLDNNVFIAKGHQEENADCSLDGEGAIAVTDAVRYTLASLSPVQPVLPSDGLVPWIWWHVKQFFVRVFHTEAQASQFALSSIKTWCAGMIPVDYTISYDVSADDSTSTSTVFVSSNQLLDANSTYALFIKGGNDGVRDERGVGIQNPDHAQSLSDSVIFQTGSDICKIREVSVSPAQHVFTSPNTSTEFIASVISTNGQRIVSIPEQYAWEWSWGPQEHPVFAIPTEGSASDQSMVDIGVRNLEGEIDALAVVRVTADLDINPQTSHFGKTFAGSTHLQSIFCERPWPGREENTFPFQDTEYFFRFHYCSDSGISGNISDDLPYVDLFSFTGNTRQEEVVIQRCSQQPEQRCTQDTDCVGDSNICESTTERRTISEGVLPQETLKRYLMFNGQNEDVIGVQIFRNPSRLDPRSWYASQEVFGGQFGNLADFRSVQIAGYDAITDGNNYYIHALNRIDRTNPNCGNTGVCSNIYHFSINSDAQISTRAVFEQIMDTLTFNTNLTDYQYCGLPGQETPDYESVNIPCTNDFACSSLENAVDCKADRTEFLHDWQTQLPQLGLIQESLDTYFTAYQQYPSLEAGTFLPRYTNSRWPSWGQTLAEALNRPLPRGDVNNWSVCGVCNDNAAQFCTKDEDCGEPGQPSSCRILDAQTCWESQSFTYVCPADADIFEYSYDNATNQYTLHGSLSYFTLEDPAVREFIDPTTFTTDRFCTPETIISPFGERCGDGIVNVNNGEQCDPPGSVKVSQQGYVGTQFGQCSFQYDTTSCLVNADCHASTFVQNTSRFTVPGTAQDTVCSWKGLSLVHGPSSNKELNVYSCSTNADCQNPNTYGIGTPLTSFGDGNLVNYSVTQNNIGAEFLCAPISRLQLYEGPAAPNTISCVGSTPPDTLIQCPVGSVATVSCNDSCQYEYGSCQSQFSCGNGVVEGIEACDDGALNGTYGHCNAICSARFAAYCGNGTRDWNDTVQPNGVRDPNEAGLEFCESTDFVATGFCESDRNKLCQQDADCGLLSGNCIANDTAQYHINRERSCAWDCQGPGGYCGDGVVQAAFEECDGGADCSAVCTRTAPSGVSPGEPIPVDGPRCGDGIVQSDYTNDGRVDEVCDRGALNGVQCNPQYGESCVYCSYDCQEVLTVDPVAFCGDNTLEPQYEACEVFNSQLVVAPDIYSEEGFSEFICQDLGTYSCNNTCSALSNDCVACVPLREPQGAEPRLALINPMIGITTADREFPALSWPALTTLQLFRPDARSAYLEWGVRYRGIPGWSSDLHGTDYEEPFTLTNFQDEDLTVESNVQCNGQYYVAFNVVGHCDKNLQQICTQNSDCTDRLLGSTGPCRFGASYALSTQQRGDSDSWYKPYPTSAAAQPQSPYYPYPVNSEPTVINQELVVSPAVPEGVYRVVLRYNKAVRDRNARLGLAVYNLGFDGDKQVGYHTLVGELDNSDDWSDDIAIFQNTNNSNDYRNGYWWPTRIEQTLHKRSVYVHYADGLEKTFTQAITIDTNNHWGQGICTNGEGTCRQNSDCFANGLRTGSCSFGAIPAQPLPLKSFAIFVTSLNGPIAQYDDMEIEVDLYTYKSDQDPIFSLLRPTATYRIQSATRSTNPQAKYWHVFNLSKVDTNADSVGDSYIVEPPIEAFPDVNDANNNGRTNDFILTQHPQGSIETGFQDIKCNTPEERTICRR